MIHSLIPSLPFNLRYPRDIAVYPETAQLSVFPFTQSHRHATNAVHVAASQLAPLAGRRVPVVCRFHFWPVARILVQLPAVPEWSDLDDCHVKAFAFSSRQAYLFA
jgi:hypothetical protein